MYVCICNAVTDREIRAAAREGCVSLRELSQETACATTCGKCARQAMDILNEERARLAGVNLPVGKAAEEQRIRVP